MRPFDKAEIEEALRDVTAVADMLASACEAAESVPLTEAALYLMEKTLNGAVERINAEVFPAVRDKG